MLAERLTQDSGLPAEGPRLEVRTLSEAGVSVSGTEDWTLNENSSLTFSKSGRRLFLGIAPIRPPKDTSIVDFETAQLDIWNWDSYLTPPQQKLRLDRTLKKTYDAVLDVDADVKTIRLLSDSFFEGVRYIDGGDGDFAVALDDTKYMVSKVWDYNSFQDVYKVDLRNGNRELLFEKLNGTVSVSPEKYLLWYSADDQHWHSYDIARKQKRNLTEPLGSRSTTRKTTVRLMRDLIPVLSG